MSFKSYSQVSDFRGEQTAHWSTHRLVVAVALQTVKKVAHPHSMSLKDTQNRIEELISKIFYIHSYMLLICSSGHSKKKKPIFNTKFTANGKCWY